MENKTVKIASSEYNQCTSELTRNAYLSKMNLIYYLPIRKKGELISSTLTRKLLSFSDVLVTYDSIDKVVFFMLSVIEGYTTLHTEDPYSDFDALMDSGLMAGILVEVGADVDSYRDLFEMSLTDYIRDHNSMEAVMSRKTNEIIQPITDLLETVDNSIKNLSPSDIEHIFKLIK